MTSKTDICNLALVEARYDETIESLDEKSVSAERCKRLYDICRKELLCNYPWSFATRFVKLARTDKEVNGFKYAYAYPSEAVRITNVFEGEQDYQKKNHRIVRPNNSRVVDIDGEKHIACDYEKPFAEIIVDDQEEENFPRLFIRLLYLEIALRLAKLSGADVNEIQLIAAQINQEQSKARVQSVGEDDNHLCVDDYHYVDVRG